MLLPIYAGEPSGKRLSAREQQILYTFDVLVYGEGLGLTVSPAETEGLLCECTRVLPKLSECQGPISASMWKELGGIRDALVELVDEKLGADDMCSKMLKFESLDSKDISSQSRNMDAANELMPRIISGMARSAVITIQEIIDPSM